MPDHDLRESFLFVPVEAICRRPAVTCAPDCGIVEMARLMKSHQISGLVVVEGETPVGIVSLRDLRDLLADRVDDLPVLTAREVMKTALITIRSSDLLFKAFFLMARHNIHRLIVTDADRPAAVITDTDLLRLQTRSPLYLVQEIESAADLDQLRQVGRKATGMLQYALRTNTDTPSLIQLIAYFNDAFTGRVIRLLETHDGIRLPPGAAYLALGSEGRQEQTLRTDQDSAIVYDDDLPGELRAEVHRFAEGVAAALERAGVPRCPGNTMASNPEWCHSISQWKRLVEQWVTQPEPDAMIRFAMLQDLRVLHGERRFEGELRSHVCDCARRQALFFPRMACNLVRFRPPLGVFGRILVEKKGAQRGKIDIKKGGLFQLTRGVGLVALEAGVVGGTTWEKLEHLHHLDLISPPDLETIRESFSFLIRIRLEKQLASLGCGELPSDALDPLLLKDWERDRLRAALRGVETMLQILKSRYQLDLVAR